MKTSILLCLALVLSGCARPKPATPPSPPAIQKVTYPKQAPPRPEDTPVKNCTVTQESGNKAGLYQDRRQGSGEAGFGLQVKQYMILRLASGIFFVCRRCEFRVKVQHRYGAARTIAAKEINEHIATAHAEGRP